MAEETKRTGEDINAELATDTSEQTNANPLESEIAALKQQLEAKELEAKNNDDRLLRQTAELALSFFLFR